MATLGERLTRGLSRLDHPAPPRERTPLRPRPLAAGHAEYPANAYDDAYDDGILPRFAITRQGYDCDAVDAHIAELEQEITALEYRLDEARRDAPAKQQVALELDRIGEQTSSILVAAHDEAQQTLRLAQSHADTVIADAASYAVSLTEEATRQLREIEAQTAQLTGERDRLLADVDTTADALHALASRAAA